MHKTALRLTLLAIAAGSAAHALAQGMPTTQPKFLHIYREEIKPGRSADHAKWEAGWPAAFEKAGSKYTYIALTSLTGPQEALFISPFADHAAFGQSLADEGDPALGPELERLAKGDGEFLERLSAMQRGGWFPALTDAGGPWAGSLDLHGRTPVAPVRLETQAPPPR